jgi:uroporphyrin-III C-methyltransferase / precorrin-2 dehydrogenase / sirohydrochlorin ferrochelatase
VTRYALSLDLEGRRVLVVGGGVVSARRVSDLVTTGAIVDVVSPDICDDLAEFAKTGRVTWHRREFTPDDVVSPTRAWLVHTATGDPGFDESVVSAAESDGVWCIHAGSAMNSPAWRPAVAIRHLDGGDEIQVAITAGGDPGRAVNLRNAIGTALDTGSLPVRHTRTLESRRQQESGSVALVGSGPGDEGLLTVRGRQLLALADVVVTDRLGAREALASLAEDVEIIDVGKDPGHHPVPQDQINTLLVQHARRGRRVVRLKGGDPFVLGRGGEEAAYCLDNDVPVEIVPGVTSAISVPAAAGIPVTYRGVTGSFVVATGHEGPDAVLASAQSAAPEATLILLMAVTAIESIADGLIQAGRQPETPVAVIENGWTTTQRTTVSTLHEVAAECRRVGVRPPAVVVVGDVVNVRERLGDLWRSTKPLRVTDEIGGAP